MAKQIDAKGKFSRDPNSIPFESTNIDPTPTRNIYALFNDGGQDLFKHGLSELQPFIDTSTTPNLDKPEGDTTRLSSFNKTVDYPNTSTYTSAKEDPVMFGFDIIIRTQESPLFSSVSQNSVSNFLSSGIVSNDEMMSRVKVYDEFKHSFFQFFRSSLETQPSLHSDNTDNPSNSRFYYYLNKVTGLDALVESNTGDTFKSFIDYGKDTIKLEFTEDVTLRVGRMAALYKSLYWSRTHGKTLIPENLLRFDCDIIVSEVRNFVRLKKVVETDPLGGLQTLKDNMNRYVYTLYDCQLFFDKMAHGDSIDLSAVPTEYTGYSVGFTYKHSTLRVDEFNPETEIYNILNNGSDDPNSFSSLDKFLSTSTNVSTTSSGIPESQITKTPQIIIDSIKSDSLKSEPETQTPGKNKPSVKDIKSNLLSKATNISELSLSSPSNPNSFESLNKDLSDSELEAARTGAPKNSWIKSDTPGARLVKKLANTGIAAANNMIAKRFALVNKTLGNLTKGSGFGEILDPKNIYEKDFNGDRYLTSKLVRNSLENFVGESISSLFTKKGGFNFRG